jgi:toxin ParE1/3/4
MEVIFSSAAKKDLIEIVKYISKDKPKAAQNWAAEIKMSVLKLGDFPHFDRIVPEYSDAGIREIIKGRYRIVYKIDAEKETIVILTVHHSKKLLL